MSGDASASVTLSDIQSARRIVNMSHSVVRTPTLLHMQDRLGVQDNGADICLKLESMQRSGSFKMRGLVNQLANVPSSVVDGSRQLVTMSAGNYGRAFAQALNERKLKGVVCMPENAPENRAQLIKGYGIAVERMATADLMTAVNRHVSEEGMIFLHPFDDLNLILGYASCGLEIVEDVPDVDIVLVCCGGGGLVSGIAAAIKLSGKTDCQVIAVEPKAAPSLYQSRIDGKPAIIQLKPTVAAGLAPPFTGKICFELTQQFVDNVILVDEEEIIRAVQTLYSIGLVVEPSGAAGVAAILAGHIDVSGKCVVIVVTGGNISPKELDKWIPENIEK